MKFVQFIHIPSMFIWGLVCIIGLLVGGRNYKKSFLMMRDISIILGIAGTLVSFINLLATFADIVMLRPHISVAMLPSIYGLISFLLF